MQVKTSAVIAAGTLLVLASLACKTITGGGIPSIQATANAALTAAASGGFAATAEAAKATADALLNNTGDETATPKPTEADGNPPDATETPAGAATEAGTGNEAPPDIPVVDATNTNFLATDTSVSYQAGADFKTVVAFYKDEMPKNDWTFDANASLETDVATILYYTKDNRKATVALSPGTDPTTTIVLITLLN
jgi:hypothetical protein